jgi:hypothetical protein
MTYILDMAGGTEYQGEELSSSYPPETRKHVTAPGHPEHQVELRLAEVELKHSPDCSINPASVDLRALISAIED